MTLIVEDGSIVSGANTVINDAFYVAYAADRGLTIGADATAREKELILAMDYLFSIEDRMKGTRVSVDQTLPEPRDNVYIFGNLFASDDIPIQYKNAQAEAAAYSNSQPLLINETSKNVKKSKVDVLEKEFFEGGSFTTKRIQRVDAAIKELLTGGSSINAVRVL